MVLAVGLCSSGCSSSNPVDQNINTDVAAGWAPEASALYRDTAADVSITSDGPDAGIASDGPDAGLDSGDSVDGSSDDGAGIDGVTPEGG